jgi:hypothetical protein
MQRNAFLERQRRLVAHQGLSRSQTIAYGSLGLAVREFPVRSQGHISYRRKVGGRGAALPAKTFTSLLSFGGTGDSFNPKAWLVEGA